MVDHIQMRYDVTLLTDHDIYLFKEGSHFKLYEKLGSHLLSPAGREGAYFAVWAPNAEGVAVTGDFNGWDKTSHPLKVREDGSGIWEGFLEGISSGPRYKYPIRSPYHSYKVDKGDPYAFRWEVPPKTASVVWDLKYEWGDRGWMQERRMRNSLDAPFSIYEIHLGSWRRVPEEGNRFLTYREMASYLVKYVIEMGFTHVEFLPVME